MSDATAAAAETTATPEARPFEADVSKLLHMMVHSVYSDRDVFLRELVSNAADACEKLRFEAISSPALLADDPKPKIVISADHEAGRLVVEDNGVGMSREELIEALGTIARSGTKAFVERLEATQGAKDGAQLIGQFGVGFYSAFMVADRVDVVSRRAGSDAAALWSSNGKGAFTIAEADIADAPARGTRVTLYLMEDAKKYAERWELERIVKSQSGHVPVPIELVEKPGEAPTQIADGAALWTRPKSEVSREEYVDFYRSAAGQFDEPALTIHYRAEGRHEYTVLAFVPSTQPFDLFDPDRRGRMKLYVRRVFITDDAELLPRWLRFVRGLVDSNDLPLNVSREMIQESPVLAAIRKGLTNRVIGDIEKLVQNEPETFTKVWEAFGAVIKEGLYEDFERQEQLLKLARFRTTAGEGWRSLADYVGAMKENQTAIYYLAGGNLDQLKASPHLEGFVSRGVEVLLLTDPVDSFWVTTAQGFEGKPFKSASQGAADLAAIAKADAAEPAAEETSGEVADLIAFAKETLGDAVSDVRASDRLTTSAVCLVAADHGLDRQLEKILKASGQQGPVGKPVLEINPAHALVTALAAKGADDAAFREDAVRLLFDEAKILDGERPEDPRAFSGRVARVLERALR
ncbi:molecular chaperone HtpG [Methylopila sp. M107]|uniref:molecular chaperone HtpG n=1 Tax=Methylopila sp. M107 TaxID=1101190 RepID=UPI00036665E6|nr:molecular chaperone HtpG [Methylopila sp. M107]